MKFEDLNKAEFITSDDGDIYLFFAGHSERAEGYYHRTADEDLYGPYETEEQARTAMDEYNKTL